MSELRSAIDGLRLETLAELPDARIEEDFAELQRAAELIDGHLSTASWLASTFRMAWGHARNPVRLARALEDMPETRRAINDGELSMSAVRVLVDAREAHNDAFRSSEAILVEAARIHSTQDIRRVAAYWRQAVERDALLGGEEKLRARRRLHASVTFMGMVRVDGDLDPETGETLLTALRAALDAESRSGGPDDGRTPAQRWADALGEVCRPGCAAHTRGATPTTWSTERMEAPRGLPNLVLLCRRHHRMIHARGGSDWRWRTVGRCSDGPMDLCSRSGRRHSPCLASPAEPSRRPRRPNPWMKRARWITCLLALITTACAGLSTRPMAAPSAQPSSPEPTLFAPSPLVVGDEARLALTFPDGTEAVIAYPGHLGLAEMGVQPDVDLRWDDRWVGAIVFSRGGPDDRLLNNRVAVHRAEVPPVEEWTAHNRGGRHQSTTRWLVFRLPSWTVHVPLGEPMEAEDVLGHVRPYETEEGFVAVQVTEPVELGEGYGEAGGPQLSFGDSHPLPDFVGPGPDGLLVDVAPANCRHFTIQVHGSYGSACLSDGSFFVNGTDFSDSDETQQKLVEVIEGIRVLELEPAS